MSDEPDCSRRTLTLAIAGRTIRLLAVWGTVVYVIVWKGASLWWLLLAAVLSG